MRFSFIFFYNPCSLNHTVCNHARGGKARKAQADWVDVASDIEARDLREPLIERCHRVPEIRFCAANAGMAAADRPVRALVPSDHGAILRRGRTFAPHLIEALALAVRCIAPSFNVLAGIK